MFFELEIQRPWGTYNWNSEGMGTDRRGSTNKLTVPGLEIVSGESPDTMTGQIHFRSVTYRFWPVKLYKINNS